MDSNPSQKNKLNNDQINQLDKKEKFNYYISQIDKSLLEEWKNIQRDLRKNLILYDDFTFDCTNLSSEERVNNINIIAGLDISASKVNENRASVAIIIMDFKTKKTLFQQTKLVNLTQPYVPGFLAFREVEHLASMVNDLKLNNPDYIPDVIVIDGNGIYHTEGFGLACHLGILCNLPTIGCGKTTFSVDGLTSDKVELIAEQNLKKKTDYYFLSGKSGKIHGAVMRCTEDFNTNIIISQGHKISLETCCLIVKQLLKFKVVEPVRLADILSREEIRKYDKKYKNNEIY